MQLAFNFRVSQGTREHSLQHTQQQLAGGFHREMMSCLLQVQLQLHRCMMPLTSIRAGVRLQPGTKDASSCVAAEVLQSDALLHTTQALLSSHPLTKVPVLWRPPAMDVYAHPQTPCIREMGYGAATASVWPHGPWQ
jgi:hypothetical protein